MGEFELFGSLPAEIQDSIWEHAIRDDTPGIHFFSVYDARGDDPPPLDPSKRVKVTKNDEKSQPSIGLCAPQQLGSDRLSWVSDNSSKYMEDSGLWTACRASRARMVRHFRPSETSPLASMQSGLTHRQVRDIFTSSTGTTANMSIQRDGDETQYITIRTSTDLVCLRPILSSFTDLDFCCSALETIRVCPPLRFYDDEGIPYHPLRNLAVEYDPSWAKRSQTLDGWVSFCSLWWMCDIILARSDLEYIDGIKNFYFIDYGLKRYEKYGVKGRKTFRAGNRIFTEVLLEDAWSDEWGTAEGPVDCKNGKWNNLDDPNREGGPTALGLVQALNSYISDKKHGNRCETEDTYDSEDDDELGFFRVLACETIEPEGPMDVRLAKEEGKGNKVDARVQDHGNGTLSTTEIISRLYWACFPPWG